jgi:hypothetical protein
VNVAVIVPVLVGVKVSVAVSVSVGVGVRKGARVDVLVMVGVKKSWANASTVRTLSVLVGVAVPRPVFGIMRSGSCKSGELTAETMKGRLNASPHARRITTYTI